MGIDLRLCPVRDGLRDKWWLLDNRLKLDKDYSLHTDIMQLLKRTVVPSDVKVQYYSDRGIETITETPYGEELMYVMSDEFNKITRKDLSFWNIQVIRFLSRLEPTPILLYWC